MDLETLFRLIDQLYEVPMDDIHAIAKLIGRVHGQSIIARIYLKKEMERERLQAPGDC